MYDKKVQNWVQEYMEIKMSYMGPLKLGLLGESISSYIQNTRGNLEDLNLGS